MFTIKSTKQNLGIEISGSFEDLNELYDAISHLCGVDVKDYEGVQNRLYGFLYELRHTYQGNREIVITSRETGLNERRAYPDINLVQTVFYCNRILWTEILFVAFTLEDYKTMCLEDRKHFLTDDKTMKDIYEEYKRQSIKDIALVTYFQECIWNALKEVIGEIRVKSLKMLLSNKKMNYTGYCSQAIDFMNKRLVQSFIENRPKVIAELARNIIKKDAGYSELEASIKKFAIENNLFYYEVDFEGNEIIESDLLNW